MFFTTSCQAELNTHINCDLAVMTVLWLLSLTPETSLLDSCSKTCISVHKLILKLILYTVAFCQLFIKAMMDGWMGGWVGGWVDGWMDGWMDGQSLISLSIFNVTKLSANLCELDIYLVVLDIWGAALAEKQSWFRGNKMPGGSGFNHCCHWYKSLLVSERLSGHIIVPTLQKNCCVARQTGCLVTLNICSRHHWSNQQWLVNCHTQRCHMH